MRIFVLFCLLFPSIFANAAGLGVSQDEFKTRFNAIVNASSLSEVEKSSLNQLNFIPVDGVKRALAGDSIIISSNGSDDELDEIGILYKAPRGGLSAQTLVARAAIIESILPKIATSDRKKIEFVKSTTGVRREKGREVLIGDFHVIAAQYDAESQLFVINRIE